MILDKRIRRLEDVKIRGLEDYNKIYGSEE
jgi:hypothetical protein